METEGGFVLNGTKMWISGVPVADVGIVYVYTDKAAKHRGMSAFMVDMHAPGVTQKSIDSKLGLFCAPTGEIVFEDVKVPKDSLVGQKGDGFKICMAMLDNTRLSSAARAVGVARACLEHSVRYANEREQFGQPDRQFSDDPGADRGNVCGGTSGPAARPSGCLEQRLGAAEHHRGFLRKILCGRGGCQSGKSGCEDFRILWFFNGVSCREVLSGCQIISDCRGDIQHSKDDHCKKCVRP